MESIGALQLHTRHRKRWYFHVVFERDGDGLSFGGVKGNKPVFAPLSNVGKISVQNLSTLFPLPL
jgi:hypothetical protein